MGDGGRSCIRRIYIVSNAYYFNYIRMSLCASERARFINLLLQKKLAWLTSTESTNQCDALNACTWSMVKSDTVKFSNKLITSNETPVTWWKRQGGGGDNRSTLPWLCQKFLCAEQVSFSSRPSVSHDTVTTEPCNILAHNWKHYRFIRSTKTWQWDAGYMLTYWRNTIVC